MLNQTLQRDQTTAPAPLTISELKIGRSVQGWLLVTGLQTRLAVTGMPYLYLKLRDQRGNEIVARQFDPPRLEALAPREGKVLLLEGIVEEYRDQPQIKLTRAEVDESASTVLFEPGTRRPVEELEARLQRFLNEVEDPG